MALLSIRLLGPMQVTMEGEPITGFESDKVRALLAYLALEAAQPHRREKLAGLLWPERPERAARANLRQALFNLRQAIGDARATPPYLKVTRQTLQFNTGSDASIDVVALRELLSARASISSLASALDLYRGHLLEGFSLADSAPFEEWILVTREHLSRQVLMALPRLVSHYAQRGAYEQALHYAWRQIDLDPWGEQGHRQVMRLLALSGQRNAALSQYRTLRQTLAEELGVEPEDSTTHLYHQIQAGSSQPSRARQPLHNLPALLTPFIGRQAELAALDQQLRRPGCRLVSLVGPGGCGKTHLALKAAWQMLSQEAASAEHGIYFVALAALRSPEAIIPAVAGAVGLAVQATGSPAQQLFDFLRQKRLLLILDNFEHLLPAVDWLVELLRKAPDVRLLVTSQARLNLQAEYVFRLGGMALPAEALPAGGGSLDEVAGYSGVALFLDGARRVQPDFQLSAANAAHVVRICRLVEGLPLGILLATTWLETMSPAEIAGRLMADLGQGLDFLEAGWRDLPQRQRSMRAVLAYSWHLLDRRAQDILARLSTFSGGFTQQAAAEVAGTQARDLQMLVHRSLLSHRQVGRYEMHELLRRYAVERLAQRPADRAAAVGRHGAYYAHALERWAAEIRGQGQPEAEPAAALAEMQAEIQNVQAAWRWAARRAEVDGLARAADGLMLFYELQVRYTEGEAACRLAVEQLQAAGIPAGRWQRLLARLLAWQGLFLHHLAGPQAALAVLDRCQAMLDAAGLDVAAERALALWHRGRVLDGFDREGARRAYEQCLALYKAGGDRWGAANALAALGGVAWNLGDYETAAHRHRASLALRQAIGDRRGVAQSTMSVGVTALYRGHLAEAEALVREGCALRQELGDLRGVADGYRHLGVTHLLLGTFDEAAALLERSLTLYAELGLRFGLEVAMLAEAQVHLANYEAASDRAGEALATARSTGYRRAIGYALLVTAEVALARGDAAGAQHLARESCDTYAAIGQWEEQCRALAVLAYARRGLDHRPWVPAGFLDEVHRAAERGAFVPLLWALPVLSLLLADGGQPGHALEAYALALAYPAAARSRWIADVAGHQIEAAVGAPTAIPPQPENLGAAVRQILTWIGPSSPAGA